jgi:glycosyltransferase involved in cell wall biosynthesis
VAVSSGPMNPWASVAMFVYGDAAHDSRVMREAAALASSGRRVLVIGHTADGLPDAETHDGWQLIRVGSLDRLRPGAGTSRPGPAGRAAWLVRYVGGLREWAGAAARAAVSWADPERPAIWHGHDLTGLVAAARARARRGGLLVYDSHELFMEAGTVARLPDPARRLLANLERRYAGRSDLVITVNSGIADELVRRYRIPQPVVVMNCPVVPDQSPDRRSSPMRTLLGLGDRPVLLHHGGLASGRGIVETIEALDHLPDDVALVVLGDGELVPEIEARAAGRAKGRLFHHPSVPIEELPDWVAGADVGVIAFQPIETNNLLATPNKLFECLAVGVPVVVSDFPEMRSIVDTWRVGATCDPRDPASIAEAVRRVLAHDRPALVTACRTAATERYSWQRQSARLLGAYDLLGRRTA